MVNKFSKFRLKSKEEEGVEIAVNDIEISKNECERSLLGKIWGNKAVNFTGIRNTLSQLWCHKGELKVVELSYNFFQFIFSNKEEKERVLLKRPWIFDNQFVVLQPWTPKLTADYNNFSIAKIWVQVKGLLNHWSAKAVGWKLGKLFHCCLNVILLENGSKEGRILKLFVELKLDCPLLR